MEISTSGYIDIHKTDFSNPFHSERPSLDETAIRPKRSKNDIKDIRSFK